VQADDLIPSLQLDSSVAGSATLASEQIGSPHTSRAPSDTHSDHGVTGSASQAVLSVAAHLGRLTLHASARVGKECWPPTDVAPPPSTPPNVIAEHSLVAASAPESAQVGDERPLIAIVAEGGLLSYKQARGVPLLQ
jgi:hypothetical protein